MTMKWTIVTWKMIAKKGQQMREVEVKTKKKGKKRQRSMGTSRVLIIWNPREGT